MEDLPLARLLTLALRLLVDEMHRRLTAAGYGDLRPVHGYVLNAAAAEGGTTAAELAGILGMTKQGAAKLVTELETAGYVTRGESGADARRRPVTLTRRGRAALRAASGFQRELEAEWAALASRRDVAGLRRTLERALENAGADADPPPLRPVW